MISSPSANGSNGSGSNVGRQFDPGGPRLLRNESPPLTDAERDWQGRFRAGNRGGPGNPHAKRVGELRAALLEAITPTEVRAVVAKLVDLAKGGNIMAIREVLDRTLGKPIESDLIERLEALEASQMRGVE